MHPGRTLPQLATELQRQCESKRDFLARADALHLESLGHTDLFVPTIEPLLVNDMAHGQLAEYVGVPKGFYDFLRSRTEQLRVPTPLAPTPLVPTRVLTPLPAFAPPPISHFLLPHSAVENAANADPAPVQLRLSEQQPLFDVVVNRLLQSKGEDKRLVRTLDGRARALLSSTFNPDLDNWDVYGVAVKAMEEVGLCPEDVKSCEVTDTRFYLKVLSPKLRGEVKVGDIVQGGFVLSNSEVGAGSLSIRQFVLRLVCQNGAIVEEAYRTRHIGKRLEADSAGLVYRSDTRQAEAKLRLLTMRDCLQATLDHHRFTRTLQQMQHTSQVKIEGSLEKVVEVTARKFGLHEDERTRVLHHLVEGADLSLWGLSNAVTAVANSTAISYDRATEIESVGGRFLALPATEVREIIAAR